MTTTIERPPLGPLSANTLRRAHSDIVKPSLPKLKNVIPMSSFTGSTGSITKPDTPANHARKLKYRLKLAYYKLKTDQVGVPLVEIIKKIETKRSATTAHPPALKKRLAATPSLTRHISLLAASTPLQTSGFHPILPKKTVSFKRSNSNSEPSTAQKSEDCTLISSSEKKKISASLPRINEYPKFKVSQTAARSLSSPQLGKTTNADQQQRSLRIEDLVDNTITLVESSSTPLKPSRAENGDLLLSSPTKKLCSSTPGSYGAAKSLLQLSALVGSN